MAITKALFAGDDPTPESVKRRRLLAEQLLGQPAPAKITHPMQVLAEVLEGGIGGWQSGRADRDERKIADARNSATLGIYDAYAGMGGASLPSKAPTSASPSGGARAAAETQTYTIGNTDRQIAAKPGDDAIFGEFMSTVKSGGLTNPFGLAAVAATGQAESGFSPGNIHREWNDPSERGQAGRAGGVMSWRADRLENMRRFAAGNGDDPRRPSARTQAGFLLNEDPELIARLQSAQSVEEAQSHMNNAWRFAGYNRPGGEAARRLEVANGYLSRFQGTQQPVQVASLDPSAGIAAATAPQASSRPYAPGAVVGDPNELSPEDQQRLAALRTPTDPNSVRPYAGPGANIDMAPPPQAGPPMTLDMKLNAAREQAGVNAVPLPGVPGAASTSAPNPRSIREILEEEAARQTQAQAQPSRSTPATAFAPQPGTENAQAAIAGQLQSRTAPLQASMQATGQNLPAPPQDPRQQQALASALTGGQTPQGPQNSQMRAMIAQLLSSPSTEDMGQQLLMQELGRMQEANDPVRQLRLQKLQQEVQQGSRRDPIEVGGVLLDPDTMQPVFDSRRPEAPEQFTLSPGQQRFGPNGELIAQGQAEPGYRLLTAEESQQMGLPAGAYQVDGQNKVSQIGGGGTSVNVNTGQDEGEFQKKAAARMVERFGTLADGGSGAAGVMQTLPQMRELLSQAPQGPVQGRLAEMFPGFSTAADAFTATVNQIAPSLRIPGSGAQSDKDMDLLLGSFPRLRNDPQANVLILDAFQTKAQINLQRSQIATAALRGELTPSEADARISQLDQTSIIPEGMRNRLGVTSAPETGITPTTTGRPRAQNPATGEVIEFDGQQWVPAQ